MINLTIMQLAPHWTAATICVLRQHENIEVWLSRRKKTSEDLLKAAILAVSRPPVELAPTYFGWITLEIGNACRISDTAPDVSVLAF